VFGQNVTEHNPAPSPSGHPLLSGPPTLSDIHQIREYFSRQPEIPCNPRWTIRRDFSRQPEIPCNPRWTIRRALSRERKNSAGVAAITISFFRKGIVSTPFLTSLQTLKLSFVHGARARSSAAPAAAKNYHACCRVSSCFAELKIMSNQHELEHPTVPIRRRVYSLKPPLHRHTHTQASSSAYSICLTTRPAYHCL
jgi:hypothetical protein